MQNRTAVAGQAAEQLASSSRTTAAAGANGSAVTKAVKAASIPGKAAAQELPLWKKPDGQVFVSTVARVHAQGVAAAASATGNEG